MKAQLCLSLLLLVGLVFCWNSSHAANICGEALRPSSRGENIFQLKTGERVAFKSEGDPQAETVVLYLNGLDKDMGQWDYVKKLLKKSGPGRLSVQVDLLGQGQTSTLNDEHPSTISFERQTELLTELVSAHAWQNKKLIIVGHSYGGGIAARFASDHPGWVQGVALINPFVDNLEIHQPVVGPMMAWMKTWSEAWGMKGLYDQNVQLNADMGMMMTWSVYSITHDSKAQLSDVMALTRGIRDINMTHSLKNIGTTRVSLLNSLGDELIPMTGHLHLWSQIPEANRGVRATILATHESVTWSPHSVAAFLNQIL